MRLQVMKKILALAFLCIALSGCYQQSLTLVGPAAGASQGRLLQSSLTTAFNHTVKAKTGKTTLEHIFIREKEKALTKVASIEKKATKASIAVKKKMVEQREKFKAHKKIVKNEASKLVRVIGIKKIKMVSQKEAFSANKPRYSYWSKQK